MNPLHRVYLRWPGQKVSHKTTTELEAVARFAFEQLQTLPEAAEADVAWTEDKRQRDYRRAPVAIPAAGAGADTSGFQGEADRPDADAVDRS